MQGSGDSALETQQGLDNLELFLERKLGLHLYRIFGSFLIDATIRPYRGAFCSQLDGFRLAGVLTPPQLRGYRWVIWHRAQVPMRLVPGILLLVEDSSVICFSVVFSQPSGHFRSGCLSYPLFR